VAKNVVFRDKETKKVLAKISVDGVFGGEVENTRGLLAYEHGVDEKDIEVVKE